MNRSVGPKSMTPEKMETETAAAEKRKIRAAALARRDSLTDGQRRDYSSMILKNLSSLPCYKEADAILTYISFRSEVETFPLVEKAFADGKAVFAPKVTGKEMVFYRIFSMHDLSAGYHGILEPAVGQSFEEQVVDLESQSILLCMPGAAFDRARHRIGYGGGFYDRYVSGLLKNSKESNVAHLTAGVTTAALAYDCQIFDEIPWESHDICPGQIVTETEII